MASSTDDSVVESHYTMDHFGPFGSGARFLERAGNVSSAFRVSRSFRSEQPLEISPEGFASDMLRKTKTGLSDVFPRIMYPSTDLMPDRFGPDVRLCVSVDLPDRATISSMEDMLRLQAESEAMRGASAYEEQQMQRRNMEALGRMLYHSIRQLGCGVLVRHKKNQTSWRNGTSSYIFNPLNKTLECSYMHEFTDKPLKLSGQAGVKFGTPTFVSGHSLAAAGRYLHRHPKYGNFDIGVDAWANAGLGVVQSTATVLHPVSDRLSLAAGLTLSRRPLQQRGYEEDANSGATSGLQHSINLNALYHFVPRVWAGALQLQKAKDQPLSLSASLHRYGFEWSLFSSKAQTSFSLKVKASMEGVELSVGSVTANNGYLF